MYSAAGDGTNTHAFKSRVTSRDPTRMSGSVRSHGLAFHLSISREIPDQLRLSGFRSVWPDN